MIVTYRGIPIGRANAPNSTEGEMETAALLQERHNTHGDYITHASTTQRLKFIVGDQLKAMNKSLSHPHAEALDMILHKIGRIVAGDANFKDHWDDIAGYANNPGKWRK